MHSRSMEMGEMGSVAEGVENAGSASAQPASQRITPYLSKVVPQRPGRTPRAHTPATGGKFAERQNAGAVVASLNAHLALPGGGSGAAEAMELDESATAAEAGGGMQQRCSLEVLGQPMGRSDKFMVDRLEDKVGQGWGWEGRASKGRRGAWAACTSGCPRSSHPCRSPDAAVVPKQLVKAACSPRGGAVLGDLAAAQPAAAVVCYSSRLAVPPTMRPHRRHPVNVAVPPRQVAFLEGRIVAAEEEAAAALGCDAHPVAAAAQQPSLFVGRICCDAEGGRLNPQSLLLEGSQRSSGGARVRLDVSRLPSFRLFPGQVVALRGTNPSGHCVVAAQLLPGLAAPPARTPLAELSGFASATGRRGLALVVAAGPFTSSEDLEYAPLGALLDYCAAQVPPPEVLLLLGPFVDAEHPLVRGGLLEESFEELYALRVSGGRGCGRKRGAWHGWNGAMRWQLQDGCLLHIEDSGSLHRAAAGHLLEGEGKCSRRPGAQLAWCV